MFRAVRKGSDPSAVYYALEHAHSLFVTTGELEDLVRGAGQDPSTDKNRLLAQGLLLGPQEIFATDGINGAYVASVEKGPELWVDITEDDGVINTLGAGDAFLAGALKNPYVQRSREERAIRGSVSSSFAVETTGAHDDPPTEEQLIVRMNERTPRVKPLYDRGRVILV